MSALTHALLRPLSAAAALALGLALALPTHAQTPPPAKKSVPKKTTRKPAPPPPPPELVLAPAEGEQTAAAALVHFGEYACEFNQTVQVGMNPKHDGYVDVRFGKQVYTMKPVLSSTGALRLEDVRGQTLMLQIAYKSMLMDVKAGRRLVDECAHDKQVAAKQAAASQPPSTSLLGGADPGVQAPVTAAPVTR